MTHLAQTFPVTLCFTDLNETLREEEEEPEQEETNKDQMTHNPPAFSPGETATLSISVTTDNRRTLSWRRSSFYCSVCMISITEQ